MVRRPTIVFLLQLDIVKVNDTTVHGSTGEVNDTSRGGLLDDRKQKFREQVVCQMVGGKLGKKKRRLRKH